MITQLKMEELQVISIMMIAHLTNNEKIYWTFFLGSSSLLHFFPSSLSTNSWTGLHFPQFWSHFHIITPILHLFFRTTVVPKIDSFHLPLGIQVGQRLSITCTVIRGDSPFFISWLKNGTPIDSDHHHKDSLSIHHLAEYSSSLLFKAIKAEHQGNYTCLAKNSVGQDSHTQIMNVHGE